MFYVALKCTNFSKYLLIIFTWKKNIVRMPMLANMQNDRRAGREELAPIPKAMKLVMEVMVMATPAWDITAPTLSTRGLDLSCSEHRIKKLEFQSTVLN